MPINDKTKTFTLSKTKLKKIIFCLLFVTFSKGATVRRKANTRAWNHTDRSNKNIEWQRHLSNHGLNGISLHSVGFELLLVALGTWLSIFFNEVRRRCVIFTTFWLVAQISSHNIACAINVTVKVKINSPSPPHPPPPPITLRAQTKHLSKFLTNDIRNRQNALKQIKGNNTSCQILHSLSCAVTIIGSFIYVCLKIKEFQNWMKRSTISWETLYMHIYWAATILHHSSYCSSFANIYGICKNDLSVNRQAREIVQFVVAELRKMFKTLILTQTIKSIGFSIESCDYFMSVGCL